MVASSLNFAVKVCMCLYFSLCIITRWVRVNDPWLDVLVWLLAHSLGGFPWLGPRPYQGRFLWSSGTFTSLLHLLPVAPGGC